MHAIPCAARRAAVLTFALATVLVPVQNVPNVAAAADGDGLPDDRASRVARTHGLSVGAVRELLAEDPTVHVGPDDRLVFIDKAPSPARAQAPAATAEAVAPLEQTFTLHSNPQADKTIFLDVDGATVAGTVWNGWPYLLPDGAYGAWDPAGDGQAFSAAEQAMVQEVWSRVAEDFAPFDVDVTTEDPGAAEMARTDVADTGYGVRALITSDPAPPSAVCGGGCAGIAYLDVFDSFTEEKKIAWIFPDVLGGGATLAAEVASHEVGHTLGLTHDGQGQNPLYTGHGVWAPIMGASESKPLTQWSRGLYADDTNREDDLAIIRSVLRLRPDEAGGTTASSTPFGSGHGYISRRSDIDLYELGVCQGDLQLAAATAALGPNLDLRLELVAADGTVVASDDPPAVAAGDGTLNGLAAQVLAPDLPRGEYFVRVDGIGAGSPASAYDDYASLGEYQLTWTGSCDPPPFRQRPSAPESLVAQASTTEQQITLTWDPPATPGTFAVSGYRLDPDDGRAPIELPASARSYTFTHLRGSTTYEFSLLAFSFAGDGTAATAQATTPVATVPSAVRDFTVIWDPDLGAFQMRWEEPETDGGAEITGYVVTTIWGVTRPIPPTRRVGSIVPPAPVAEGDEIPFSIQAVNAVGKSVAAGAVVIVGVVLPPDTTAPVVTCPTEAPVFALNDPSAYVSGTLVDDRDPLSEVVDGWADTASITSSRTAALFGYDTAGNVSNIADCGYTVAAGFGGYRSPSPRTKYAKSASIPVKFTLTDAAGPLTAAASAELAANGQVRAILTGPGLTAPLTAPCTWNPTAGNFACAIKAVKTLRSGSSYHVIAQEKGTATSDTFFTVPGASSTTITFK